MSLVNFHRPTSMFLLHRSLLLTFSFLLFLPAVQSIRVHLVTHSHTDAGWLKTVDQYFTGVNRSDSGGNVHQILDSVLLALTQNPQRRFSYGEQAFFQRWVRTLTQRQRQQLRTVVERGQLEFINGGWVQHDEGDTHYTDMIDQTSLGHRAIRELFGESANPRAGWQIDPFGHSSTHVALMTGEAGFDGFILARMDQQETAQRRDAHTLEFLWQPSPSLPHAVFTYILAPINQPPGFGTGGYYGCPWNFCFNVICYNNDVAQPIQDDPSLDDYNVPSRVEAAIVAARNMAAVIRGENQMWTIGDDFHYEEAGHVFSELDKLIRHVNANGTIEMLYSTPATYIAAKQAENITWTYKYDDAFPIGSNPHSYTTGYFTSRPALKRYTRVSSQLLNVARHWSVFGGLDGASVERLWEAVSLIQHHDAVAGTERQPVADDYAMRLSSGGADADAAMQQTIARTVSRGNASSGAELVSFQSCPLSNYSICPVSQQSAAVVVLLYNPLARERVELHSVAVEQASGLAVYNSTGQLLPSQLVPVPATQAVWQGRSAPYSLQWQARVPALGFATYFVVGQQEKDEDSTLAEGGEELAGREQSSTRRHSVSLMSVAELSEHAPGGVSIENGRWRLSFDSSSGQLQSAYDKQLNTSFPLTLSFLYYKSRVGRNGSSSPYSFAPDGDAIDLSPSARIVAVVHGQMTQAVTINVTDWLTYTVRLVNTSDAGELLSRAIEVDYVIGPVPVDDGVGKEVIVRYAVPTLSSDGVFYTDSNGREYQQRIRDHRSSWNLTLTEPISSNYYPVVTTMRLVDAASNVSLYVLTDRANGGSSLSDGEVEVMLHRRLVNLALAGEALDELQFGRGLVIRGSHSLLLGDDRQRASDARLLQNRLYAPLSASYAPLTQSVAEYISAHLTSASYCNRPLPPHVELISLYWQPDGSVILRLAHSFGAGETSSPYAQPVTVDLSTLFTQPVAQLTEVTLTANRRRADMERERKSWQGQTVDGVERHVANRSMAGLWADGRNVTIAPMEVRTFNVTFAA